MPPCFATTSLQVLRKLAAICTATSRAFCEARMLRTRALKAVLPIGGRFFRRSSQSFARIFRRNQAHIFSTGFKSGEDAGICQMRTPAPRIARLLRAVCKKASLSQRTVQGPCHFTGAKDLIAWVSLPRCTSRHQAAE